MARFIAKFQGLPDHRKAEYTSKQEGGHKALKVMEQQLSAAPYLAGDSIRAEILRGICGALVTIIPGKIYMGRTSNLGD